MIKISHEERFTDFELFGMFNFDVRPNATNSRNLHRMSDDEPYAGMSVIKHPLLHFAKKRRSKRWRMFPDNIRPEVSQNPAGSRDRIEDMAAYYAEQMKKEENDRESAFDI